jgi:hypothetical protein
MAYQKKTISKRVSKARIRLGGMKRIDANLQKTIEYGNIKDGIVTSASMQARIDGYLSKIEQYNQALKLADALLTNIIHDEEAINSDSAKVLDSAPYIFGVNSDEIIFLGGKKMVDRKRPGRKRKPKPTKEGE